ncbi:carbohydrate ABC transporter permease [Actinoplanes couchii]|uniref:Sugar ABC transporter permease n=1 Tax=Actinoplanes couchii TaxID=403638 RepID=A0ABQ3X8R2_9ACTN|nr:carbohydrate ABC transporter permease [Actinoplanes couchii]MDR6320176.1 ABC-type glycerol-3-phosphate transport system permease component [Actinoplanes couchii]GID54810.1 sugar ABC transporter permease [Actinoplanes couchii]
MKALRGFLTQTPLALWTAVAVVPFLLIATLGFRDNTGIFANPLGLGGDFLPENFATAWNGPVGSSGLQGMLLNSLSAFVVALILNLGLGSLGAFFGSRLPGRAKHVYLSFFVLGTVVPAVLLLVPLYRTFNSLNALNSPWALGVVYGLMTLPTTVIVLHGFFTAFPEEVIEAAKVDGLGEFAIFLRIVVPLSLGALTTAGLLLAVWVWSETQIGIVLLQNADSQTAAVGILGFKGRFTAQLGPLFAGLTIIAIPVIALFLGFHRTITKGIALGGVSK